MAFDYEENKKPSDLTRKFAEFVKRDDEEKWQMALELIRELERQLAEARAERDRLGFDVAAYDEKYHVLSDDYVELKEEVKRLRAEMRKQVFDREVVERAQADQEKEANEEEN